MSVITPNTETKTDVAEEEATAREPRLVGVVAEFDRPDQLVAAAKSIRDAGYTRWDTFTPFPIHGMDEAMGIRKTILPWLVFFGGITGTTLAIAMQWYFNASHWAEYAFEWPWSGYQYPISGKPYWSLPANIPIAFELTVLLAALTAFFGMLILNRLLQWYNPLFKVERFKSVTDDRFFVAIDARDPKFDAACLPDYFTGLGARASDECWDDESRRVPKQFFTVGLVLFALSLIPPVLVMRHRSIPWTTPRLHPVSDMDFQMKFKSQQSNIFFADNRAMRPLVEGTVARGTMVDNYSQYYLGINPGQGLASVDDTGASAGGGEANDADSQPAPKPDSATADDPEKQESSDQGTDGQPADAAMKDEAKPAADAPPENPPAGMNENQNWVETIPIPVTEELMARGKEQYEIYCAPCHGFSGYGDGIVNERAMSLPSTDRAWVRVPSLHTRTTRNRPDGYIYRAISEGVRKMPSYGDQITPHNRWAIVLYVRALQRSQGADPR